MNKNTIKIGKLKKLELSVIIFLFVLSLPVVSVAQDKLDALRDLKGVFVNLNIRNKVPQGIPRLYINKKYLLDYTKQELVKNLRDIKEMRLFKSFDPHLKLDMVIEGKKQLKENMYYVTVNASLKHGAKTWHKEYNTSFPTQVYKNRLALAEALAESKADLQKNGFQNHLKIYLLKSIMYDFAKDCKAARRG